MNLIDPSLEVVYCSNLISNYSLIRFIRFVSRFTGKPCNAFFISSRFNPNFFRILNYTTKQGLNMPSWSFCASQWVQRQKRSVGIQNFHQKRDCLFFFSSTSSKLIAWRYSSDLQLNLHPVDYKIWKGQKKRKIEMQRHASTLSCTLK